MRLRCKKACTDGKHHHTGESDGKRYHIHPRNRHGTNGGGGTGNHLGSHHNGDHTSGHNSGQASQDHDQDHEKDSTDRETDHGTHGDGRKGGEIRKTGGNRPDLKKGG